MAKIDIRFDFGFDRFEDVADSTGASDNIASVDLLATLLICGVTSGLECFGGGADTAGMFVATEER